MPNTFLEKTIEDWLTKSNELGYQLPFCQILINQGMRVVHISKHNAFEQGKDVIAIDGSGQPHAYQLKGGTVTLSKWRDLVRAEIDELMEIRIKHPAVDPSRPHISYLVTNGYLDDTVRVLIDDMNNGRWSSSPLRVITRGQLLPDFIELSGSFVPSELAEYRTFLDLYFSDGCAPLDRQKFGSFIEQVSGLRTTAMPTREHQKRSIAVSVLYTAYILEPFRAANNHIAVVHSLTMLAATILAVAERRNLPPAYWEQSFDLVSSEIEAAAEGLVAELNGQAPMFKDSPYDGALAPYRRQLAISCYLAYFTSRAIAGTPDAARHDEAVLTPANFHMWGEGAVPDYLLRCLLLVATRGPSDEAFASVLAAIRVLTHSNGPSAADAGVFSPFYTAEEVAMQIVGMADEPVYERFVGSAYSLAALVLVLVRYGRREELSQVWREVAHISNAVSLPDERWEDLVWRCDRGVLRSFEFEPRQAWSALQELATTERPEDLPRTLQMKLSFLPYFLIVYPHRLRPAVARLLVHVIDGVAERRRPTPPLPTPTAPPSA